MTKVIVAFCSFANALNEEAQYEDKAHVIFFWAYSVKFVFKMFSSSIFLVNSQEFMI